MENIKYQNYNVEIPCGLSSDYSILAEILSVDTWNNEFSDEQRKSLMKFLPRFPNNDMREKTYTLQKFFMNDNFFFDTPIQKFYTKLTNCHFNPKVSKLREAHKKILYKKYKYNEKKRCHKLLEEVLVKRKRLLDGYNDINAIQTQIPSTNSSNQSTCLRRAHKRYLEEKKSVKAETGFDTDSEDDFISDEHRGFLLTKKQRRQISSVDSNFPMSLNIIRSSNSKGSLALDVEASLTPDRNPYDTSHDEQIRIMLKKHMQKRKTMKCHTLDTRGITLRSILRRCEIDSQKPFVFPTQPTSHSPDFKSTSQSPRFKFHPQSSDFTLLFQNSEDSKSKENSLKTWRDSFGLRQSPLNFKSETIIQAPGNRESLVGQHILGESQEYLDDSDLSRDSQQCYFASSDYGQDFKFSARISEKSDHQSPKFKRTHLKPGQSSGNVKNEAKKFPAVKKDLSALNDFLGFDEEAERKGRSYSSDWLEREFASDSNTVENILSFENLEKTIKKEKITSKLNIKIEDRNVLNQELAQETHLSFFSLIRDIICLNSLQRMSKLELQTHVYNWQNSTISPLNHWFGFCDSWQLVLPSAINFLCGNFKSECLLPDFVPYIEFKKALKHYQWIGAGRDSDHNLEQLCKFWLSNKDFFSYNWYEKNTNILRPCDSSEDVETGSGDDYLEKYGLRTYKSYHEQEILRYSQPHKSFTFNINGKKCVIGPVKGVYSSQNGQNQAKARGHQLLVSDRPPYVTILSLVWDAIARLPDGEGSKHALCQLLKESQFLIPITTDLESVLNNVASGALDRLQSEKDSCVKYDSTRKLWTYLHKGRSEKDLELLHHMKNKANRGISGNKSHAYRYKRDPGLEKGPPNVVMERSSCPSIKQMDGSNILIKDGDILETLSKTAHMKKNSDVFKFVSKVDVSKIIPKSNPQLEEIDVSKISESLITSPYKNLNRNSRRSNQHKNLYSSKSLEDLDSSKSLEDELNKDVYSSSEAKHSDVDANLKIGNKKFPSTRKDDGLNGNNLGFKKLLPSTQKIDLDMTSDKIVLPVQENTKKSKMPMVPIAVQKTLNSSNKTVKLLQYSQGPIMHGCNVIQSPVPLSSTLISNTAGRKLLLPNTPGVKVLSNTALSDQKLLSGASFGQKITPQTVVGQKLVLSNNRLVLQGGKVIQNLSNVNLANRQLVLPSQVLTVNGLKNVSDKIGARFIQVATIDPQTRCIMTQGPQKIKILPKVTQENTVTFQKNSPITLAPRTLEHGSTSQNFSCISASTSSNLTQTFGPKSATSQGEVKIKLGSTYASGNIINVGGKQIILATKTQATGFPQQVMVATTETQSPPFISCSDIARDALGSSYITGSSTITPPTTPRSIDTPQVEFRANIKQSNETVKPIDVSQVEISTSSEYSNKKPETVISGHNAAAVNIQGRPSLITPVIFSQSFNTVRTSSTLPLTKVQLVPKSNTRGLQFTKIAKAPDTSKIISNSKVPVVKLSGVSALKPLAPLLQVPQCSVTTTGSSIAQFKDQTSLNSVIGVSSLLSNNSKLRKNNSVLLRNSGEPRLDGSSSRIANFSQNVSTVPQVQTNNLSLPTTALGTSPATLKRFQPYQTYKMVPASQVNLHQTKKGKSSKVLPKTRGTEIKNEIGINAEDEQ